MSSVQPKTYCDRWPDGCMFCDLLLCDGTKETAEKRPFSWRHENGELEALKPCPFCGSEADIAYNTKFGWSVYCTNDRCFMNTLTMGTDFEEAAIAAWNRRANDGT